MMGLLLGNTTGKALWIQLNSGKYVQIPALGNTTVEDGEVRRNPSVEKMKQRGVLKVAKVAKVQPDPAPSPEPKKLAKKSKKDT